MFDALWEIAVSSGNIWCGLCVILIYKQSKQYDRLDQRHDELEVYVRDQITRVIEENTRVLDRVEDKLHANANRS